MAQFGESRLFRQMWRKCNAGSAPVPEGRRDLKTPANAAFIVVKLK